MQKGRIEFKGRKEGLYIISKHLDDFDSFIRELEKRIESAGDFFSGACVVGVYGLDMSKDEQDELRRIMMDKYLIKVRLPLISEKGAENISCNGEAPTRFIHSTLRSGQRVFYDGNIVVLGDVNAGAEVEAGRNIVVMGSLRGVARAGIYGDKNSFISAVLLKPIQLRIGDVTVRWPEGQDRPKGPETAYVQDGKMYVKPIFSIK
jgi:septum site-determining protein MinC